MPNNLGRILWTAILLVPLLSAFIITALGIQISGRDDVNYLSELQSRPYLVPAPDQISWIVLKFVTESIPDQVLALRLVGLLICFATCLVMLSKRAGGEAIRYFVISIAPLYWILYFNQLRLGLAIAIYLLLLTRGRWILAPFGGALAHASVAVFIVPPSIIPLAIIAAPFMLGVIELLDPASFASVRFAAYRDAEYLLMPWYFGWELIAMALVSAYAKMGGRALGLIIYAVAVRMLADQLSVEVARRFLELGLFIFSPVISYLRTRVAPTPEMLMLYVLLGLLSLYATVVGGVVSVGRGM